MSRILLAVVTAALALHLSPATASAQRLGVALGPAFTDARTPGTGIHARGEALLLGGRRTFNLAADAYVSRLRPVDVASTWRIGFNEFPAETSRGEWQAGIGLSGVLTLFPSRRFSPYLLVGGTARHSWIDGRVDWTDPRDGTTGTVRPTRRDFFGDLLLGAGTWLPAFGRPLRIEVRAYGGSTFNFPVTIALPF